MTILTRFNINARDAGIFYWDKSTGLTHAPWPLTEPVRILQRLLLPNRCWFPIEIGMWLFLGATLKMRWHTRPAPDTFSDQENPLVWQSLATNTAGDLRLGSGSKIVTAVETRQQIIVFTDVSLHAMQFLGPPYVWINQVRKHHNYWAKRR